MSSEFRRDCTFKICCRNRYNWGSCETTRQRKLSAESGANDIQRRGICCDSGDKKLSLSNNDEAPSDEVSAPLDLSDAPRVLTSRRESGACSVDTQHRGRNWKWILSWRGCERVGGAELLLTPGWAEHARPPYSHWGRARSLLPNQQKKCTQKLYRDTFNYLLEKQDLWKLHYTYREVKLRGRVSKSANYTADLCGALLCRSNRVCCSTGPHVIFPAHFGQLQMPTYAHIFPANCGEHQVHIQVFCKCADSGPSYIRPVKLDITLKISFIRFHLSSLPKQTLSQIFSLCDVATLFRLSSVLELGVESSPTWCWCYLVHVRSTF